MKQNQRVDAWSSRAAGVAAAALFVGSIVFAPVPAIQTGNTLPRELPRERLLPGGDNPGGKINSARGSQRRAWRPVRMKVKKQGGHGYQR